MPNQWYRLEAAARSIPLSDGLAAKVADPLWALARQHQVGEFRGDDAAQPAAVRVNGQVVPLGSFRGLGAGGKETSASPLHDEPLEARVERVADPSFGGGSLHAAVRAGARLTRLLRAEGFHAAAKGLQDAYGVQQSTTELVVDGGLAKAATQLMARRGVDGHRLARGSRQKIDSLITKTLGDHGFEPEQIERAIEIFDDWKTWCQKRSFAADPKTWDEERLEHRFSVAAAGPKGEVLLEVPEHWGGHLDWYSFDVSDNTDLTHGLGAGKSAPLRSTFLPASVRYAGMPASRWWEFEDNAVHFGDLEAGPADLARLLVAEFATVYGDDWFVVPVKAPLSSLVEVSTVEVFDNFDNPLTVRSLAHHDSSTDWRKRPWRFFELSNDELSDEHPSPWLLIPPSVVSSVDGPALEQVTFNRDEGANLAWGIERKVEGPLGRAVDRSQAWAVAHPPEPVSNPTNKPVEQPAPGEEQWRYRLEAAAPPWWIPLIPERIAKNSSQVRLRRSRMDNWSRLTGAGIGPQSQTLDPHRPIWLREEEVPRSGVRIERRWQMTRWHDGSMHLWLQRQKRPGRGEASSGVGWDLLEDT